MTSQEDEEGNGYRAADDDEDEDEDEDDRGPQSKAEENCCQSFFFRFYDLIKSITMRLMLSATIFILTWRAAAVNDSVIPTTMSDFSSTYTVDANTTTSEVSVAKEPWFVYWMPCAGILLFVPEFVVVWCLNNGHEYKWWSPVLAIYVSCCLLSIWVVEMNLYTIKWNGVRQNPNATSFDGMVGVFDPEYFGEISGFTLFGNVQLRGYEWSRVLQQLFFIAIVFARWLGPKGALTRHKLSQLLLVYITIATDILDLMDTLMYVSIGDNLTYVTLIMVLYSLAHFQFTLNFTATMARPARVAMDYEDGDDENGEETCAQRASRGCVCFYTDMWAMFVTMFLQDGPFFIVRLYFIIALRLITFGNIFFTVKNGLILTLDIYRIITILIDECGDKSNSGKADEEGIVTRRRDAEDGPPNRAEFKLVINAESAVSAVAEFVLYSQDNYGNRYELDDDDDDDDGDGERWKRKLWRNVQTVPTFLEDDANLHLIYEVELILDKEQAQTDDVKDSPEPVCLQDVRFRNVKITKAEPPPPPPVPYDNNSVLRHRISRVAPAMPFVRTPIRIPQAPPPPKPVPPPKLTPPKPKTRKKSKKPEEEAPWSLDLVKVD